MAGDSEKEIKKIYQQRIVRPGTGTRQDINDFMAKFLMKNTVRYEEFSSLWRESGMPYLFAGRLDMELREAVDETLKCLVGMFMPDFDVLSKAFILYVIYAIYEIQCVYPKVKIRVTAQHFIWFNTFINEMAEKQHFDLVFVFTRLRLERAFLFVATLHPQGNKKSQKSNAMKAKQTLPLSLVTTFSDISMELVEDLSVLHDEYHRVKCAATNPGQTTPHPSVDLVKDDFIRDITKTIARFDEWRRSGIWGKKIHVRKRTASGGATTSDSELENVTDSDSAAEKEDNIAKRREQIRSKAFSTVAPIQRSSRYRQMISSNASSK